jgi:fumarate hydratase class II
MQQRKIKLHFNFIIETDKDSINSNFKVNVAKATTIGELLQSIDFALNSLNEMKNDCIVKFINQENHA